MKKTAIAMMTMMLILIGTTWAQPQKRPTKQIGNPIGLGGTVTSGVKKQQPATFRKRIDKSSPLLRTGESSGDTGTHEVSHKTKRRPTKSQPSIKFDGIDGESNYAQMKNANAPGKNQNLLPYVEQDNVKRQKQVSSQPKKPGTSQWWGDYDIGKGVSNQVQSRRARKPRK